MKTDALLFFAALVGQPSQQFDLICKGQWRFSLLDEYQPHDFRMHVDLSTGRYCEDECKAIKPIAEIQPGYIAFEQESPEERAKGWSRTRIVNRQSGKFLTYIRDNRASVINVEAQCEPAPFTGFPNVGTKF